jgi:hypothetical protein
MYLSRYVRDRLNLFMPIWECQLSIWRCAVVKKNGVGQIGRDYSAHLLFGAERRPCCCCDIAAALHQSLRCVLPVLIRDASRPRANCDCRRARSFGEVMVAPLLLVAAPPVSAS